MLRLCLRCASVGSGVGLAWFWWREDAVGGGEGFGTGRVADRTDVIFPLEMTYTVQKSGAAFKTLLGTSVVLNLLRRKVMTLRRSWNYFWVMDGCINSLQVRKVLLVLLTPTSWTFHIIRLHFTVLANYWNDPNDLVFAYIIF